MVPWLAPHSHLVHITSPAAFAAVVGDVKKHWSEFGSLEKGQDLCELDLSNGRLLYFPSPFWYGALESTGSRNASFLFRWLERCGFVGTKKTTGMYVLRSILLQKRKWELLSRIHGLLGSDNPRASLSLSICA